MSETSDQINQAAILLMSLTPQESSEILKHLDPKEVQKIGKAMTELKDVKIDQAQSAIKTVLDSTEKQTSLGLGSDENIRDIIINAFGEDQGSHVVDNILKEQNASGLDALRWMEPRSIADLVRFEHPQIQALILTQLEPEIAAAVLELYDERTRLDLIMRISNQESVQPSAIEELNHIIQEQLNRQSVGQSAALGGTKAAADILNMVDPAIEEQLMEAIKEKDEDLATSIEELMFVFENLLDIDDRGIQSLLREVSTDVLILALKGADEAISEKIYTNMSKRAADLLKDDLEAKGPVKLSEVEAAQKDILETAKKMADAGEISMGGKGEQML